MKYGFVFFLLLLVLPSWSEAAVRAGFPSQAIWVSKSSAIEGETLVVSAVVYNSESEDLHGTLVFTADDARIGAQEFELPGGGSQIHSIEWKPKKGTHRLTAQIEGTPAALSQSETSAIEITVAEPPPPSAVVQAAATVSNIVGSVASTSLPIITSAVQSVYGTTEALRTSAVAYFKEKAEGAMIDFVNQSLVTSGESEDKVLSAETGGASDGTSNTSGFEPVSSTTATPFSRVSQTAAAAALFFFDSRPLFYLTLILLALGTLYWLARKVRRPQS